MTTPVFAGRVEAKLVVPTGGAAVSATNVAMGPVTCTVPAASYYLTTAGGVSSLLTTLQTQLNENCQPYPTSASSTASALGGTWTTGAGWLMNEASGNLAAVYGAPTLTATSLTYQTAGPRGGIDYAIGFDAGTDNADGGNVFNPGLNDLIVAYVGKWSVAPVATNTMISKVDAGLTSGWGLWSATTDNGIFCVDGVGLKTASLGAAGYFANEWHVGIAVIDRSTGKMRFATRGLTSLTTSISSETTVSGTITNASNFRIGASAWVNASTSFKVAAAYVVTGSGVATGLSAGLSTAISNFAAAINAAWTVSLSTTTGLVSINWSGYSSPLWSLSWTNTTLRDLLGFTADISAVTTTQTGTKQARGLWLSDCPLNLESDPYQAPKVTDLRSTVSPTGAVIGLVGNSFRRHHNIVWSHVPKERTWESAATYANASFEYFYNETQLGLGSSWFTPYSPIQIYAHDGTIVGGSYNSGAGVSGWNITNLSSIEPKKSSGDWTGLWHIEIPEIVSSG